MARPPVAPGNQHSTMAMGASLSSSSAIVPPLKSSSTTRTPTTGSGAAAVAAAAALLLLLLYYNAGSEFAGRAGRRRHETELARRRLASYYRTETFPAIGSRQKIKTGRWGANERMMGTKDFCFMHATKQPNKNDGD